jgi:hypothetical protein
MNEPTIPRDRPLRGIVLMLAALAFSYSDAASKLMTATLPAVEVAWRHRQLNAFTHSIRCFGPERTTHFQ